MAILQGFREKVHRKKVADQLRHSNPVRKTPDIKKVEKIGILFDCSKPEYVVTINRFAKSLKQMDKKVELLGFFDSNKEFEFGFPYFNKKKLNWYLKPSGFQVEHFTHKEFDILINAYLHDSLPLEYISSMSQAKFRIGRYQEEKNTLC